MVDKHGDVCAPRQDLIPTSMHNANTKVVAAAQDIGLTTSDRQNDTSDSRCVAHIARAGPFGDAPYRHWPADAHWEGLPVVPGQHVLRQVLTEAIVGVGELQALHDCLYLQHKRGATETWHTS